MIDTDSQLEVKKLKAVDPFTDENSVPVHMMEGEPDSDEIQPRKPVAPPRRRRLKRKSGRSEQKEDWVEP